MRFRPLLINILIYYVISKETTIYAQLEYNDKCIGETVLIIHENENEFENENPDSNFIKVLCQTPCFLYVNFKSAALTSFTYFEIPQTLIIEVGRNDDNHTFHHKYKLNNMTTENKPKRAHSKSTRHKIKSTKRQKINGVEEIDKDLKKYLKEIEAKIGMPNIIENKRVRRMSSPPKLMAIKEHTSVYDKNKSHV
jgi:hypothetical protein